MCCPNLYGMKGKSSMSTHGFISRTRKDVCLPLKASVPILGALLMTLLYLLSPAAQVFAASVQRLAAPPPQNLARAGVSVVRLVVTYNVTSNPASIASPNLVNPEEILKAGSTPSAGSPPTATPTPASSLQCTGLGVIVASWMPSGSTNANNLILTDGNLVQNNAAKCVTPSLGKDVSKFSLSSITVYFSTAFNSKHVVSVTTSTPIDVRCKDATTC